MIRTLIIVLVAAMSINLYSALPIPISKDRIAEIEKMLPDGVLSISARYQDRAQWNTLAADKKGIELLASIDDMIKTGLKPFDDKEYVEAAKSGIREHSQKRMEARFDYLFKLVVAEAMQNRGKYVPEIEKTLKSICEQTTWIISAHDMTLATYYGKEQYVDLSVATAALGIAESMAILNDKLSPEIIELVSKTIDTRVLAPIRKCYETEVLFNWFTRENNWNSVCLSGIVGTANAMGVSKSDRALYIALAEAYSTYSLRGYEDDGYCGEGVAYYSYGYRSLIVLREILCRSTNGSIDLFSDPKLHHISQYWKRIRMPNNMYPLYSDARKGASITAFIGDYCDRAYGVNKNPETISFPPFYNFGLNLIPAFSKQAWPVKNAKSNDVEDHTLRSFFPLSNVYTGRPLKKGMSVSFKINHNGEPHNHNDVGTYTIVTGRSIVAGDQGCPTSYPSDWWNKNAYNKYKSKGSFGHSVPVVDGKQQKEGIMAKGVLIDKTWTDNEDIFVYDLTKVYDIPYVTTLTRTFVYDRKKNSFTVTDEVEATQDIKFETAITTGWDYNYDKNVISIYCEGKPVKATISSSSHYSISKTEIQESAPEYFRIGIKNENLSKKHKISIKYQ